MRQKILFLTMRHTGAFFFCDLLSKQHFNGVEPRWFHTDLRRYKLGLRKRLAAGRPMEPSPFVRIHTEFPGVIKAHLERYRQRPLIITTERPLDKIKNSYLNRYKNKETGDDPVGLEYSERMFESHLKQHNDILEFVKPDFTLTLEEDVRDERLAELSAHIGRELITDWAPINQTSDLDFKAFTKIAEDRRDYHQDLYDDLVKVRAGEL